MSKQQSSLPSDQKIKFSFEYYDLSREDYCLSGWQREQIKKTLGRLKDINTKSFQDLSKERFVYHFGEVDWSRTTEKNGFTDTRLKSMPAFHFSLLGVNNQKTRVFGAYSAGVFYIVWFDLNHQIWPSALRNT